MIIKDADTLSLFDIESDYFLMRTTINRVNFDSVHESLKIVPNDDLPKNAEKPKRFLAEDHHIRKVRKGR